MRINLSILGFMVAAGTTAAGFVACGGSVETQGTGAASGTGGAGGAQSTTTTVTASSSGDTTTTTVTSSSSSSSSGGGDDCKQACDHLQTCINFDVCGAGFNLDCANPQNECTAKCINALSCGDLNMQSAQACLQQCAPPDAGVIDAGDPCMNACAHVQQCTGFDVCAQIGTQFDCSNPQNECIADCLNATPCAQLGVQTFQSCQQMCQGSSSSSSSSSGSSSSSSSSSGGSAQKCQQCAFQSCQQQAIACAQNTQCAAWAQCVAPCNDQMPPNPACSAACDAMYASAKPLYASLYACTCTSCSTKCSGSDPCNKAP